MWKMSRTSERNTLDVSEVMPGIEHVWKKKPMGTLSDICRCDSGVTLTSAYMLHLCMLQWSYFGRRISTSTDVLGRAELR